MSKNIVILGAGYGGVLTALTARKYLTEDEAKITVVNKYPTHQIITELHRLAAGNVSEKRISLPLNKLFKGKDIDVVVAEVESFSAEDKKVRLSNGDTLSYDVLVVGLGSVTGYFGIPGLEENSLVLKSVEDANKIREHITSRIKAYAETKDPADATILIGGGGLTGVELVGELADELPELLKKYGIRREEIKLKLVEAGPKILPVLPDELIEIAQKSLEERGVEFLIGVAVTSVEGNVVSLGDGSTITTNSFVWTGGVAGNPVLADSGLELNRGRASVNEYLQSTNFDNVFVVGDSAVAMAPNGRPYPPTAQNAWQMGELVGYNLFAYINQKPMEAFNPADSGTLASLGRKYAVAKVGDNQTQLKGLPAMLLKEASNARYLSHIKGLFTYAY
ncbi:NAD(P)/FAD-dependent oxidoreductase [Caldibacillus thermolactis]|jgi:NADH:ubiquinone reductase (H+-translocating)|uniref:NAD(P)/FAD-dependent oxidoreductase n=1 Tax=Pallidibacillus thermolactis TaxID=251051 RepID=A0ABT2WI12_9BACI|nr:NAD(P)/FAD-dependent oxidoreductase [Pallidibacillus thermolactis]MCU9595330.1 NAD(P)/FAD-dependent oxidoreductase [Pallidibacillus thermolactis]MCU9602537.1 NAD(P)/FAD-dependent oxidoreductase [Pallidibacillus thermolactis subsp. kokeshiiformis]MED1674233.1 NAD(P)/FAD-dependent oxidoreductase [Pallidibacillus thermolactis subsp. kokeshiiformis]